MAEQIKFPFVVGDDNGVSCPICKSYFDFDNEYSLHLVKNHWNEACRLFLLLEGVRYPRLINFYKGFRKVLFEKKMKYGLKIRLDTWL